MSVDPDLTRLLKRLKLGQVLPTLPERLTLARAQQLDYAAFLTLLLADEVQRRDHQARERRLLGAGFEDRVTLDDVDWTSPVNLARRQLQQLVTLEFLARKEHVILVGPPGVGKSHLLVAAGQAAVLAGFKVRSTIAADLVETRSRGLPDHTVGKVIDQLLRHDAILVDELGFAPLDDSGTQLLVRFVAAAYERRSLGVASHWPFDPWGRFLPQQSTAASLLDRLLHHAVIVVTEGESFRMQEARSRAGGHPVRTTTPTTTPTRRAPGGPTSTSVA